MNNKAWVVSVCLLALVGSEFVRTEEPAITREKTNAQEGRFIDAHVHFHDRNPGDMEKIDEWMKANNVQRIINHPLLQSRARDGSRAIPPNRSKSTSSPVNQTWSAWGNWLTRSEWPSKYTE